ncbi:DUF3987 domain-containing protein [Paludifilum halophilum]|uniref:DNA primase/polymerase bifunctional N-terminal domain-containing protein n=1 Tax=Paludifilum halophilum TaxID=1642702 RepID=A0A235B3A5_9BACL|nr:DUF3987 domain-containing protein [Paludifilum halophilum]OYD06105.1 hypothetical protein CHM34_18060 [Paludifilum halophilum]
MALRQEIEPLDEALRLSQHGVKVIQLHAPTSQGCTCQRDCGKSAGKHPILTDWSKHATADPDQIRYLWNQHPWANVGVPMGNVNGLFALDIDGPKGQETLQKWIVEYGDLPPTWQVMTGGGGMQLWYRVPNDLEIPNSVKKIGLNIDIRGTGGQSVAPGSLHQSGKRYQWAPTRSPEDLEPSKPPEWLVDKIREIVEGQRQAKLDGIQLDQIDVVLDERRKPDFEKLVQLRNTSKKFKEIIDGKRSFASPSERDLSIANIAAVKGWTDQEIADLLIMYRNSQGDDLKHPLYYQLTTGKARKWANEQKVIPLKPQESENMTVQEVEPIPLPKNPQVEPFPVDVFPEPVRRFLEEVGSSIGLPTDYPGVHALNFLGAGIGNTRVIELKKGYRQQPNLYSALVADTGTGKSPALEQAFEPILSIQKEYAQIYQNQLEEYDTAYRQYQAKVNEWKKKKDGDPPTEPERPLMKELYVTQATMEALLRALKNNNRGIVLKADELSGWIGGMNQYKGGKGDDREHYLSLWSGSDVKVNRVRDNGEPLFIPKPFCSVTGNIPPDILPTLNDEQGNEDGFIHRVLLAYPDSQDPAEWTWEGISDQAIQGYADVFQRLYNLKPEMVGTESKPKILTLTTAAKKWWAEWFKIHIREMKDPDFSKKLRGPWAKMPNQLARIALIIHMTRVVCSEAEDGAVDEISLSRGIQLVRYFKSHIRKAYQELGKSNVDKRIEEVVDWIRQHGGKVKKRDIQRKRIGGCKKASDVDQLFNELEDHGYGQREKETPPKGGPKTITFKLFI